MKKLLALIAIFLLTGAGCTNSELAKNTIVNNNPEKNSILNYSGKELKNVPMELFDETNATALDLSRNRLTGALPAEIRKLSKLKNLNLSNNEFTGVPAEIGQLKNLEVLDLSNNKLTGLPYELGNLTNLKKLILTGNNYSKQDLLVITKSLPKLEVID